MSYTTYVLDDGGFGYEVNSVGIRIRQETIPAVPGNTVMTQEQANKLGELADKKIQFRLNPAITVQQVADLLNEVKTSTQIINEELGI